MQTRIAYVSGLVALIGSIVHQSFRTNAIEHIEPLQTQDSAIAILYEHLKTDSAELYAAFDTLSKQHDRVY